MNSHDDKSSRSKSARMMFHLFGAMCIFAAGSFFGSSRNVHYDDEMNGYNDRALNNVFKHESLDIDGIEAEGVDIGLPVEEAVLMSLEEIEIDEAEFGDYSGNSDEETEEEDLVIDAVVYDVNGMTTVTPEIKDGTDMGIDVLKHGDFEVVDEMLNEREDDSQTLADYDLSLGKESNSRELSVGADATYHASPAMCLLYEDCRSFSMLAIDSTQTLVIPCGECYEVDITDGSVIDFPEGLRVEGELRFPSTSNVVFRTKFVFVLGLLKIDPPTLPNQVKFQLYQEDEITFVANDASAKCGAGCNMGSKVIAVLGGKLDIRGYNSSCPAWEKVKGLGPSTPRPFSMPTDADGKSLELEINGRCYESPHHTKHLGKYTVSCPIKNTALIRHGESKDVKFTSLPPIVSRSFEAPIDKRGLSLDLSISRKCGRAGHTNQFKRCVVYCPLHETADVPNGESKSLTFTSVKPTKKFVMPISNGEELIVKMRSGNTCKESKGHTNSFKRTTVYCLMEETVAVRSGPRDTPLKFTNRDTGESFGATGILHWAWAGKYLFFFPDVSADEVNRISSGLEMEVDYDFTNPGGQTMEIDSIYRWASEGKTMLFFPKGYSDTECNEAADEMNQKFPVDYGIDISWSEKRNATGQEVTLSNGVHHWAWNSNQLLFHPDQTADEFNAKFPPGYRIGVSYGSAKDHHQIKVSRAAGSCWGKPGTELVLSSSTRSSGDRQITTVTGYDDITGIISVENPLKQPIITLEDSSDFAVEITALNRPVVFEAESNADDAAIGGHLIIHETDVAQHVEGVEIKNFGQQGRLGRYPIHFHKCGDSVGSMIKRNVVRESNQRCYVMHCSNNVTLEENVAFDTVGHCYFLEDGSEIGTTFRRNIAIDVKKMDISKTAMLGEKSKRKESDKDPAAFWISNAGNSYYGNIAAGSASTGYWFETIGTARKNSNLIAFEDNEAHSSSHFGFTAYPPGWQPTEINVIKNLKVYRNRWGALLHGSRNLRFEGGMFADNGSKGVMINRADSTTFDGTVFIGNTGLDFNRPSCSHVVGIDNGPTKLFEFETNGHHRGAILINTQFHNYTEATTGCKSTQLMFNSAQVFTREFSAANRLENVQSDTLIEYDASEICPYMDNIVVEVSGDIHKAVTTSGNPGFLASEKVTTMLPSGACLAFNTCLHWCEKACLRTVAFATGDAAMPEGTIMIVKDTTSGKEIIIERALRNGSDLIDQLEVRDHPFFYAKYTAALPKGNFEVHFEKRSSPGERIWPGFVRPVFEAAPICTDHIIESDLTFLKPQNDNRCDSLIYNGNFETDIAGWNGLNSANIWDTTSGLNGSGALKTTEWLNWKWISQWLDSTCIQANETYEILISYRLVDGEGVSVNACDGESNDCPLARIASSSEGPYTRWDTIATTHSYSSTGFNTISGAWTVTLDQGNADRINFVITGGNGDYILDNVSIMNTNRPILRKR